MSSKLSVRSWQPFAPSARSLNLKEHVFATDASIPPLIPIWNGDSTKFAGNLFTQIQKYVEVTKEKQSKQGERKKVSLMIFEGSI